MKILVFQHVPHEHAGYFTEFAKEKDIELEVIKLWESYSLPDIGNYNALIVLGGPMGVYEDFTSKNDEVKYIQNALGKVPILGICLGSQLLAFALGAKVYKNVKKEIGYYDVELTKEALQDPLFKGLGTPLKTLQWHGDTFDIPEGATLLATAPDCKNQAFVYKNAYGLQFHHEFTPEMVLNQIQTDKDWVNKNFEFNEELVKKQAKELEAEIKNSARVLFENLVGLGK